MAAKNIGKSYGEVGGGTLTVLDDINFTIARGEMVSFMGPSGSGKTTLLQICGLLDRADSGDVEIDGMSTCYLADKKLTETRRDKIGFVYQMHYLFSEFSALENVELPLLIRGRARGAAEKEALEMLDELGMFEKRANMPSELSGGEKQRVAIARALVTRPTILLADEPTGNLDKNNAERVLAILRKTLRTYDTSMLIVTHDRELARTMDRTMILEDHRVVERPSDF
ncbi:MAG: ABC transporter ATP-binding protein [Rickettsiales bacterium]|nr:ABC transporter ATP-binding protein [Rickettsiales bacterium]